MHAVVALALPAVEAFDLAIPAQVFGDRSVAVLHHRSAESFLWQPHFQVRVLSETS